MDRQALLLRLDELKREIAGARDELARAERNEIALRIDVLEGVLADTRKQLVDTRRAIAETSAKRSKLWPGLPLVIALLAVVLAYHCR